MKVRIFIVDDEPAVAKVLETYLEELIDDFEVIPASNGQEAIEKMAEMLEEEVPPDVTLMDLRMPVMDGVESSKQLSAMGVNNIHILTAYVDSDLAKVAVTVGVKGIIDKKEGFKAIAGRVAEMIRDMREQFKEEG
jgi:CheY-like chemotaxis protein